MKEIIKAIIFDLGGVFIDLDFTIFYEKIISPSPLDKPQTPLMLKFFRQSDIYHQGNMTDEEFYNLACDILQADKKYLNQDDFFKAFNSILSGLNNEMVEILQKLKEEGAYKLICISNINSSHWEYLKNKNWEFINYFDELILSHKVHLTKPDHEIFKLAINKAECQPEQILYIDDGHNNIKSAEKLGINGIKFIDKEQLIEQFKKFGINI